MKEKKITQPGVPGKSRSAGTKLVPVQFEFTGEARTVDDNHAGGSGADPVPVLNPNWGIHWEVAPWVHHGMGAWINQDVALVEVLSYR